MIKLFERSLLLRMGLMMATITVLALGGMVVSVVIAEMLKGEAGAINQAGSLRMQSYYVLSRVLAAADRAHGTGREAVAAAEREFEARLTSPRLVTVLPADSGNPLRVAYERIRDNWYRATKPLLASYLSLTEATPTPSNAEPASLAQERTLVRLDEFVTGIDHLVQLLEEDAEAKIQLLRLFQGVSLFLTLVVVFLAMYFMQTDVVVPLADLLESAEHARKGDFSQRAQHTGADELGRLGHAFNVMAQDLSKLYANLEARVTEKTRELTRSNLSLETLYRTLSRLTERPLSETTYRRLLEDIAPVLGADAGVVCLIDEEGEAGFSPAATYSASGSTTAADTVTRCAGWQQQDHSRLQVVERADGTPRRQLWMPLGDQTQTHGMLVLDLAPGRALEPWQHQLVEAVGRHTGIALGTARRAAQARRMALLEERTAIARELHDSLAQSLSFLKIQVTRLQSELSRAGEPPAVKAVVDELREGMNGAYRQLRELLTTFRIQIDGRGLAQALEDTVEEFRKRTETALTLDNRLAGFQLSANEEIHVLQMVREALSNVVHHARARHASVTLSAAASGMATVVVEDDGVGIRYPRRRRHHYGMAIMQERAHSLGGHLGIQGRPGGGTRVELSFRPAGNAPEPMVAAQAPHPDPPG